MGTATNQKSEFESWLQQVVVPTLEEEDAGKARLYSADEALDFLAECRTLRQMFKPDENGKVKVYTVNLDALTKLQDAFKGAAEDAGFESEEQLVEYVLSVRRERQSRAL